jgi:hypothetical protein
MSTAHDKPTRGYEFAVGRSSHVAGMHPITNVLEPGRYGSRQDAAAAARRIDWRLTPVVVETPKEQS